MTLATLGLSTRSVPDAAGISAPVFIGVSFKNSGIKKTRVQDPHTIRIIVIMWIYLVSSKYSQNDPRSSNARKEMLKQM